MKQITFIHAADLHLDSPMIGLSQLPIEIFERLKESTFVALRKLTGAAIKHQVDFVLLAGDLFDEQDRSVRAQMRLRKEMEKLAENHIPVFVIYGNHDHLNGDWIHLDMPKNVHIFGEKVEIKVYKKKGIVTRFYGFSYATRHVMDSQLDKFVKQEGADFHIGLLHGYGEGSSDHGHYAPFHTKDLVDKKFDYWALGHIHKRSILHEHPYIVYPGNIQGRNKKETGKKGCYLVTMTTNDTKLDFIETADIQWESLQLDGQEATSFQELFILCQKTLEDNRKLGKGVLLSLTIQNVNLSDKERTSLLKGDLLQALQDEEQVEDSFVWPVQIGIEQSKVWNRSQLERESEFYYDLFQEADNLETVTESMVSLYDHPIARKYLPALSENEKKDLRHEALQTLIRLLDAH
jgi:DNA repair protein SbcD/Mre11